jgi:hypothetical protein
MVAKKTTVIVIAVIAAPSVISALVPPICSRSDHSKLTAIHELSKCYIDGPLLLKNHMGCPTSISAPLACLGGDSTFSSIDSIVPRPIKLWEALSKWHRLGNPSTTRVPGGSLGTRTWNDCSISLYFLMGRSVQISITCRTMHDLA